MFYDPQDQKVFVSTNAKFLEEDYMIDNKPKSKIILEEIREEDSSDPVPIRPTRVTSTQDQGESRRSGRVVIQSDRFIGLGDIPVELETDSCNYDEAVQDKDATLWQRSMKTEMESMYSNQVWTRRKPSLGHVRIWGSPAHVLKRDPSKLETRIDVCLFVGYPKGTKGYIFYDPQD